MGGVIQWLRNKIPPIGKWCAFAIILAGLAALGTAHFAHLFLPEEWIMHNMQILGWVQFVAYWGTCSMAVWLFISWVRKNMGQWADWLTKRFRYRFHSWRREFFSSIRQIYEQMVLYVDRAIEPFLLVGFICFFLLACVTYFDPDALSKNNFDQTLEELKFYAYLVGGIILIWQVRISNRRATALEKTTALSEKSNIAERFNNTIEYLGNTSEAIRIGGIYGLYHVVRESRIYADIVLKIMCAHAKSIMAEPTYTKKEKPSNEIAAILDVLFHINYKSGKQGGDVLFVKVNISYWYLHGADVSLRNMQNIIGIGVNLSSANLVGADLTEANLEEADLSTANLSQANLAEAHMFGTNLSQANLSNAILLAASLRNANFQAARLTKANLVGADLWKANLAEADLAEADLAAVDLSEANLSRANLVHVDLADAHLSNANLSEADLSKANLSEADLAGADLSKANLSRANLSEANLSGANLLKAHVTAEQLLQANTLDDAKLDGHIHEEIMRRKPKLLSSPAEEE